MSRNQKKPTHTGFWRPVRWAATLLVLGAPAAFSEVSLDDENPANFDIPMTPVTPLPPQSGTDRCTHGGTRTFRIAPDSDLIGENQLIPAMQKDSLYDIACRYNVGVEEIFLANDPRNIDHWSPGEGTKVLIPQHFILPDAPRAGIVVNIPEMRLYFYPVKYTPVVKKAPPPKPKLVAAKGKPGAKGKPEAAKVPPPPPPPKPAEPTEVGEPIGQASEVISYPISMGRMDWQTPVGKTRIASKVKDPTWTPPESIRREHAAKGDILPAVVPAGPANPLGRFAMRLGVAGYLIHGTEENFKSFGIGMRVTHGCMRMYNEDVARLFPMVSVGTPVYLVNQPIKLGWQGDTLYMEVSRPLDEDVGIPPEKDEEQMTEAELAREEAKTPEQRKAEEQRKNQKRALYLQKLAIDLIQKANAKRPILLDRDAVQKAVAMPTGLPVEIGKAAPPPEPLPEPAAPQDGSMPGQYPPAQATPPAAAPRYPYGSPGQAAPQRPAQPSPSPSYPYGTAPRPVAPANPYGTAPAAPRPAAPATPYPYGTVPRPTNPYGTPPPEPRPVTPATPYPYGTEPATPRPAEPANPYPYGTRPTAPPPELPDSSDSEAEPGGSESDTLDPYAPDEEEPAN